MPENFDEGNVIKGLKKGDAGSFDRIFYRYNRRIYSFAFLYLKIREEAEEVVQEVFMKIWKYRSSINTDYSFSNYIYRIAFTSVCNRLRNMVSEKHKIQEAEKKTRLEDCSTEMELVYNDLLENVGKLIESLPEQQKKVYLLSKESGLSNDEISQQLNISKKTVENHLNRAKSFLKKALVREYLLVISLFIFFRYF